MTTIIDHAINIPSPTQIVWALVSDPELFPRWQADCQRVAFLTTQRRGKNTRLRCMGDSGKEYVMEISAWYEGLGYEYKIIDGGPYETNQGRIRLQEIAEGTVVQWTFSYSLAGVLGSLRNMGVRRAAENQVVDSLRNLYRFVRDSAGENNIKVIKSMMQDAPDVDQRATYAPRHPSQYDEERIRQSGGTARPVPVQRTSMRPIMDEPLPADDDTQRNRAITVPPAASVEAPLVRPPTSQTPPVSYYSQPSSAPESPYVRPATNPMRPASEPVRPPAETRRDYSTTIPPVPDRPRDPAPHYDPRISTGEQRAVQPQPPVEPPPQRIDRVYRPEPDLPVQPVARTNVDPMTTPPPLIPSPAMPPTILSRPSSTSIPTVPDRPIMPERSTVPDRPVTIPDRPATNPERPTSSERPAVSTDTGKMSVFELFGLTKPSETQQMKPIILDASGKPVPISGTQPRVDPVPTPLTAPSMPAPSAEASARAAFQAGMPQTGDVNPEGIRQGWRALHRRQMLSLRRPTKPQ